MTYREPIAIVGMGGIFPGSPTPDMLWKHIIDKRDLAQPLPDHRIHLALEDVFHPDKAEADKVYARNGYLVDDCGLVLDYQLLKLDPNQVEKLDPMFTLGLYAAQEAFKDAVMDEVDRKKFGIIIGNIVLPTEAASAMAREIIGKAFEARVLGRPGDQPPAVSAPENARPAGLPAAIISKALGLGGGGFTLDAACASSLYALKLAVDELQAGRAEAMITGGISRPDCLYTQMGFSQLRALSPRGKAAPFDRSADGLVVGEGAGMFVLKRLSTALAAGDRIYALVRGIGLSNDVDGSLLSPSSEGQLRAMRAAYEQAGWHPWDVDLVECHATGTPVGDRVEAESLATLWQDAPHRPTPCVLGSVKSNVGHLLTAAGAASLSRAILAMRHKILPPTANFHTPIEPVRLAGSFEVLAEPRPWVDRTVPRRAAVSAFGFGGINAHLLLEEWPNSEDPMAQAIAASIEESEREAIAVVGVGAQLGSVTGIKALCNHFFTHQALPGETPNRWGLEHEEGFSAYFERAAAATDAAISRLSIPMGAFRIPPNELKEMLPQQLLMLLVAMEAMADAGLEGDRVRTDMGVFVGIGLDLETTHYQLRWHMHRLATQCREALDLAGGEEAISNWIAALQQAVGPALNANRVLGGLGSITASRLARELRLGGPSFTLSSDETSGLHALATAVNALRDGSLRIALVGAADFPSEARAAVAAAMEDDQHQQGLTDGAIALVLEPLSVAKAKQRKIYAVIDEVSMLHGSRPDDLPESLLRRREALAGHYVDVQLPPASEGAWLDALQSTLPSTALGNVSSLLGRCGALAGLASFLKTLLALHHQVQPGLSLQAGPERETPYLSLTRHWLRNRVNGPRRAGCLTMGRDGQGAWVSLVEAGEPGLWRPHRKALVFMEASDLQGLVEAMRAKLELARTAGHLGQLETERKVHPEKNLAIAFLAATVDELVEQLKHAIEAMATYPDHPRKHKPFWQLLRGRKAFYSEKPLGPQARMAFVYPGSGSQFADMGREMVLAWPEIAREADRFSAYLEEAMRPNVFWSGGELGDAQNQHAMLLSAQVALGILATQFVTSWGIQPQGSIGYSLGESTGLLALGAWQEPDVLHRRTQDATLFHQDLAGPCLAVRKAWHLEAGEPVDWTIGVLVAPEEKVRAALTGKDRVYLLIVNTPTECVVGGQASAVANLVEELGTRFFHLRGVVTVHCEVMAPVAEAYRNHHLFVTSAPPEVSFYSGGWGKRYAVNRETAADAILAQAMSGVHFPKTIEAAHEDGFNLFIEMGPGASCSRMIGKILKGKPHVATSVCLPGANGLDNALRFIGRMIAERIPIQLDALYPLTGEALPKETGPSLAIELGGKPFEIPTLESTALGAVVEASPLIEQEPMPANSSQATAARATKSQTEQVVQSASPSAKALRNSQEQEPEREEESVSVLPATLPASASVERVSGEQALLAAVGASTSATNQAHEAFLRFRDQGQQLMTELTSLQVQQLQHWGAGDFPPEEPPADPDQKIAAPVPGRGSVFMDREQCLEFAVGSIARVLGPSFTEVDSYPTRVRLPDEPLMLVDRILEVSGEWMDHGQVITEHDVLHEGWYLDGGRIPTCIAIESGQADLFLSAYLGIDFHTKGKSTYRLLDAAVTFHDDLPEPGKVIRYDIQILRFFRQADTHFFYFQFEGSVDGKPLLTMRNGCAGFFSSEELAAGRGVVRQVDQSFTGQQKPEAIWRWVAPERTAYSKAQLDALRSGDLAGCFGPAFGHLPIRQPIGLPDGRMNLVHRVTQLDPWGGDYGLGLITAEADVKPGDWFLVCHFVDDQVMPGTLMYECCLHTLRVFLYRLGWVGERDRLVCQPVIGIASQLKCRGQVLETTKVVTYEVHIKEIGYEPEPYAIADALMYADDKRIVDITGMCLRFSGLDLQGLEQLWSGSAAAAVKAALPADDGSWIPGGHEPHFSYERLLAFALGKPSQAFGLRYTPFDDGRKIARFPNPPFLLMSRIVDTDAPPWVLTEGVRSIAEYDVPGDAWYFAENRTEAMPYSILLEIALQSCGWLAAYMGSALHGEQDLLFRNLGGNALQHRPVTPQSGTLRTHVHITSISKTRDVILEFFEFEVHDSQGLVFSGDTYFGFFTQEALANQVGITDARPYEPPNPGSSFALPSERPFPAAMMRMLDEVEDFSPHGGPLGLGFVQGWIDVDPEAWFFKAHFFQDPVWPGSLGLESFIQLLAAFAWKKYGWRSGESYQCPRLGTKHSWSYRGQVTPDKQRVKVQAVIEQTDEERRSLRASGYLSIDGLVIYAMKDFELSW